MSTDRTVVHMVVGFIGLIALILAAGLLVLDYQGKLIDPLLATLAGGAVGSLATLLASTRGGKDEVQPVEVTNSAAQPVPTTEAVTGNPPSTVEIHPDAPASSDL